MTSNHSVTSPQAGLMIRVHLTDGSVESLVQTDETEAQKLFQNIDPSHLFSQPRLVIAGDYSKSVFVSSHIVRIDFIKESLQCWEFPSGYSDIVELSEAEFTKHSHLDEPKLMVKRNQHIPVGDMLVSFLKLHLTGGKGLFLMVEFPVKLPAENQSFMRFLLSKGSFHMRLRGGGLGVVNLANLVGYTVYPGVADIPTDSWKAEPQAHLHSS